MSYDASQVAYWFVKKADAENMHLDQMKLMKLVYIAQGIALANNFRLFDESIQAWRYGPVIESLYHKYKHVGLDPIKPDDSIFPYNSNFDEPSERMLRGAWENFKEYTGIQLSNWTHEKGSPWYQSWEEGGKRHRNHPIRNDVIAAYFRELLV